MPRSRFNTRDRRIAWALGGAFEAVFIVAGLIVWAISGSKRAFEAVIIASLLPLLVFSVYVDRRLEQRQRREQRRRRDG